MHWWPSGGKDYQVSLKVEQLCGGVVAFPATRCRQHLNSSEPSVTLPHCCKERSLPSCISLFCALYQQEHLHLGTIVLCQQKEGGVVCNVLCS